MIIKKILAIMLALSLYTTLSADTDKLVNQVEKTEAFQVSNYEVWIVVPSDWEESETENLDLQLQKSKSNIILSAYGFLEMDLAEGQHVQDYFEMQNEYLLSKRDNIIELEPISSIDDAEKTIYSVLYSAERDGIKNSYNFFFIDFKNTDNLVWIVFTGVPSVIKKNKDSINDIISKVQDTAPLAISE